MSRRNGMVGLVVCCILAVSLGVLAIPAFAQTRTLLVNFIDGSQTTVTVDAPANTPVAEIKLPPLPKTVVSVTEITTQATTPTDSDQWSGKTDTTNSDSETDSDAQREQADRTESGNGKEFSKGDSRVVRRDTSKAKGGSRKGKNSKLSWRDRTGRPTSANPTLSLVLPGAAQIGVPNFMIEKFRVPPFLLPIYQAAGTEYGIPWQVLAAINEIETNYGNNLNVSSAGALGWMQFMPSTWKQYGVDANNDRHKDPYNPMDSIFSAARYLRAAGAEKDLRKAIFAYNHADWYVDSVILRARLLGALPEDMVSSLTGLTEGIFPVDAKARYADDLGEHPLSSNPMTKQRTTPVASSDPKRRGIKIFAATGSPVVAVNDGRIKKIGVNKQYGRYVVLQDLYGNTYTYAHLGELQRRYLAPKPRKVSEEEVARELQLPPPDPKPRQPASSKTTPSSGPIRRQKQGTTGDAVNGKERLYAHPTRTNAYRAGGQRQLIEQGLPLPQDASLKNYFSGVYGLKRSEVQLKQLAPGAQVIGGTILGRIGQDTTTGLAPHLLFEIRPAGRGAPKIDPKPILDGWKLLESTASYRAAGLNPLVARTAGKKDAAPTVGQVLLMSKESLEQMVLADPRIKIYDCGRRDIEAGAIDRRVLATLEYLASSGLKPTVASLHCGHSFFTKGGSVSEHTTGTAVDIAAINDVPIAGHQGKGSITEEAILKLLSLQGIMKPHQIISLMKFKDTDNTYAMGDHGDHIHIGFKPMFAANAKLGKYMNSALKPGQWSKLMNQLNAIDNPSVPRGLSKYAIPVREHEPLTDAEKALER